MTDDVSRKLSILRREIATGLDAMARGRFSEKTVAEIADEVRREADGIAALDRGEGIDFDGLMDEIDTIIADAERRMATRRRPK